MKHTKKLIVGLALSLSLLSGVVSAAETTSPAPTQLQNVAGPTPEVYILKVGDTREFTKRKYGHINVLDITGDLNSVVHKVTSDIFLETHAITGIKPGIVTLTWAETGPFDDRLVTRIVHLVFTN